MNRLLPLPRGLPLRKYPNASLTAFPAPSRQLRRRLYTSPFCRQKDAGKQVDDSTPPRLTKPTGYALPSHPSRTPSSPYGRSYSFPTPSRENAFYPNMLPPPGTFTHWFITNRTLHFYLSLSILFTLAGIVSITNFLKTSPYADLVPSWSWDSPIASVRGLWDAVTLHIENESRQAEIRRKERAQEIEKRGGFRKKHGLEKDGAEGGFGGWSLRRSGSDRGDV